MFYCNLPDISIHGNNRSRRRSPFSGRDLVRKKVRLLSVMAGDFESVDHPIIKEFNVVQDLPAARKLVAEWPTPIVWSGFEVGIAVPYPARSIEGDFSYVSHHPAAEAYYLYNPPPHERPTWDLTSTLYAVRPDRGYFDLSPPGLVSLDQAGVTHFSASPGGRDRYLIIREPQIPRLTEALTQLASQPPIKYGKPASSLR